MDKKGTYIIAGIIIVAVTVFVIISFQRSSIDTRVPGANPADVASTSDWVNQPAQVTITPKTVITAKHAYQAGAHIVAGEVPLPTKCDILESSAIASPDKKQVLIQLVSSVKSGESCPSDITPARFKVTVKATKDAKLSATLNGQEVTLNLIEAGPNDNLDNFELYIKG
jgi:hypothetical protein